MQLLLARCVVMLLCLGASSLLQAQESNCTIVLKGRLVEAGTALPVAYARLYVKNLKQATSTDSLGRFTLRGLCEKLYQLSISHLSYRDQEHSIRLLTSVDTLLYMESLASVLEEVQVDAHGQEGFRPEGRLSRRMIRKGSGKSFGEVLEQVPGVTASKQGNSIAKPMIDGLEGTRVVILNNDIAQEDQQWGRDHAPSIDLLSMEEVSILHGPGLLRYSTGATGGVIVIRPPSLLYEKQLRAELLAHYSSNGRRGESALKISRGFLLSQDISLATLGTASIKRSGDLKSPNYILSNTGTEEKSTALLLGLRYRTWTTELQYSLFYNTLGILRSSHTGSVSDLLEAIERTRPQYIESFSYDIRLPKQSNRHDFWRVKSSLQLTQTQRIELLLAYQRNHRQEYELRRGGRSNRPSTNLRLHTYDVNLFWDTHMLQDRFLFQLGTSFRSQLNFNVPGTGYKPFLSDYTSRSVAIFTTSGLFVDRHAVEVGLRYDRIWQKVYLREGFLPDIQVDLLSAMGSYSLSLGRYWELSTHLGLSERAPAAHERYSQGIHHGSATLETGNPNLQKERSLKTELHLHCKYETWTLEARVYHQFLEGFIYGALQPAPRLTIRGAFPLLLYQQHDASLYGTAIAWGYRPWSWLDYRAQLSLLRTWNEELQQPLSNIPADRIKQQLQLRWQLPRTPTTVRITHKFVDRQERYPDGLDLSAPPLAYHLFGLALSAESWEVGRSRCQLSVGIDNLFNRRYRDYLNGFRYFADESGRNIWLRIEWLL